MHHCSGLRMELLLKGWLTLLPLSTQLGPFVRELCAIGYIPLPGDVDCIMGGPPCQGVSGLNRHGKTEEIIDDPR